MPSTDPPDEGGGFERRLERFVRDHAVDAPAHPARRRGEISQPGQRSRVPARRTLVAYVLAVLLPVLVGLVAVPWRDDHSTTIAIVLVLPVVAVAVLGATGPAVVAALSAGLTYDVLFTEPFQRLTIDDPDDVVATIALVVVGLAVGLLSSRLVRLSARAAARRVEVQELIEFMRATADAPTAGALADEACERIRTVLGLVECRWDPDARGGTSVPLILPDGNMMGFMADLDPDRAKLPRRLELPAVAGTAEIGRFLLTCDQDRVVSYEERLTAAAVATLFASAVASGRFGAGPGGWDPLESTCRHASLSIL